MELSKMFFLATFVVARPPDLFPAGGRSEDKWRALLGEEPLYVAGQFAAQGMLRKPDLAERLYQEFGCLALQRLAEKAGLEPAARKADLIEQLIAADRARMVKLAGGRWFLKCSDEGYRVLDEYLQKLQDTPEALARALRVSAEELLELLLNVEIALSAGRIVDQISRAAYLNVMELCEKADVEMADAVEESLDAD